MTAGRPAIMLWAAIVTGTLSLPLPQTGAAGTLDRINHFVVIYQENWSFDSLYGRFPGANGIANAGDAARQVDKSGQPYAVLPPSMDNRKKPPAPDARIPADLPNAPYNLAQFVLPTDTTGDLVHRFYHEQYQINGGKMDKFVAWSDAGGLVMSYYDATNYPVGQLAPSSSPTMSTADAGITSRRPRWTAGGAGDHRVAAREAPLRRPHAL